MRILLIYPTGIQTYSKAYLPPLVLAQLSALTPHNHEVTVINDAVDPIPYGGDFDLVGISSMTHQATRAYQIAKRFKQPVVLGGFHPTVVPDDPPLDVDTIVLGEAEDVWEQVIDDFDQGWLKPVYWGGESDLQRKVIPDWSWVDPRKYECLPWVKWPLIPIFTTRGCPLGCDFCSVALVHGRKFRHRPLEHISEEVDRMSNIPKRFYFIVDDNLTGDEAYARELFQLLRSKRVHWFGQITANMNLDLIPLMAESGCSSIFVGIETISQKSLNSVHKGFNKVEKYEELFTKLYKYGIIPFVSMIFGFDGDDEGTFDAAIAFLDKNNIMLTSWWMLSPAPGTKFAQKMAAEGRILDKPWKAYDATSTLIAPSGMDPEAFTDLYWRKYKEYYDLSGSIRDRVQRNHNISDYNLGGATVYQRLARRQVGIRKHTFAMGSQE